MAEQIPNPMAVLGDIAQNIQNMANTAINQVNTMVMQVNQVGQKMAQQALELAQMPLKVITPKAEEQPVTGPPGKPPELRPMVKGF